MLTDLHLHTNFSDGTLSPTEMVKKADAFGIKLISICDHNTVDAYPQLAVDCAKKGIKLITGVEIDCFMGNRYVHLLGYGFNLDDVNLLAMLAECKEKMQYSNDAVIINMANDYSIDLDEYAAYVSPPEIGGYKNSNFLLHKGIIKSISEYFTLRDEYGVKLEDLGLPQLKDACAIIKSAGGVPVLAHPWDKLDKNNFVAELKTAADSGIMGLECYYPYDDETIAELCIDFCNKNNLLITAGSDDHGEFNKVINGVVYQIGESMIEVEKLKLNGIRTVLNNETNN